VVTNTVYLAVILFIQTLVELTPHGLRIWMIGASARRVQHHRRGRAVTVWGSWRWRRTAAISTFSPPARRRRAARRRCGAPARVVVARF
jgi:hypothetical protein